MKHSIWRALMPLHPLIAVAAIALSGCSPAAIVTVTPNGAGTANFSASISPTAESIVRRFIGDQKDIFDRLEIAKSLGNAGFTIDSLSFPEKTGIDLTLTIPKLNGLLENAVTVSLAEKRLSFTLSRDSVKAALTMMPQSTNDYLDLLMAPVFTGETLSAGEYEEIIASAYGKTIAEELKKSSFMVTVRCPTAVRAAKASGTGSSVISGSSATFSIPLAALLAMETPITASVEW